MWAARLQNILIKGIGKSVINYKFLNVSVALGVILLCSSTVVGAKQTFQTLDEIVAVVNEDVITRLELESEVNTIKQQIRSQGMQLPAHADLVKQVLERMVVVKLQLQIAQRRNIRVDDDAVNRRIEEVAQSNKMDLIAFSQAVRGQGLDFDVYRKNIRDDLIITRLQRMAVRDRIAVTDDEIDNFLANENIQGSDKDEFHLGHILVAIPEAATSAQIKKAKAKAEDIKAQLDSGTDFSKLAISKSDGQQALEGGDIGWRKLNQLPTLFSDKVVAMKQGQVSELIKSPSGFHLIKLMGKRRNEKQHIVQQTKVRHILVKPNLFLNSKEARLRAAQLKQRIEGGELFQDLARANSDDKASAADGGNLGWVNPGVMVKPFENAMNQLKEGEISDPVRTAFGWHILQVQGRRSQDNTEEFQRGQARAAIQQRKWQPALVNWIRRIRDEAFVEVRI